MATTNSPGGGPKKPIPRDPQTGPHVLGGGPGKHGSKPGSIRARIKALRGMVPTMVLRVFRYARLIRSLIIRSVSYLTVLGMSVGTYARSITRAVIRSTIVMTVP